MTDDIFDSFPGYTGWVPDEVDDRDFTFVPSFRVPWGSEAYLRKGQDRVEDYWDKVYNQSNTNSCTANAVAAAYSFELNRFTRTKADSEDAFSPSRSFIYYNARKGEPENDDDDGHELVPDDGSQIRLAMRSLQKFGVCADVTWPLREDTVRWYPGPYAFYEAQRNMIQPYQYKRLDVKRGDSDRQKIKDAKDVATMDKDGDIVLNNLRSCISRDHPVVFGFRIFLIPNNKGKEDMGWKRSGSSWTLPSVPRDRRHYGPKKNDGGHAVMAVGFLDGKKKDRSGWVLCQNSWGSDDGQKGAPFFWIPYDYITDFSATMDFWMMDFQSFPSKL